MTMQAATADPTATIPLPLQTAWHFTAGDKLRDGRPVPPVGEPLRYDGPIVVCETGLHASERLIDALGFAPGEMLHRVQCREIEGRQADKLACRDRRILWSLDATDVLRAFARRVALDVAHLWDMPPVVREYMETGREDLRAAARDAAWAAARAAARAAAMDAVRAAAMDAVRAAAMDAAWAAARDAARAAAMEKYSGWLTEMVEAAHAAKSET